MPVEAPHRLSITEYQDAPTVLLDAAHILGVPKNEVVTLVKATNMRLAQYLGAATGPLQVVGDGLRVEDIAGLLRLSPRLEMEISPKFLGDSWERWREDFFLVATLSRYGKLLARDRLSSGVGDPGDLATLVGRALVDEYWRHHRRPLRTYQRRIWRDFAIEGDVSPEDFMVVDPDGFEQQVVQFSRTNKFNSVMHAAASLLLSEVRDSETRQQLRRVRDALAPQVSPHGRRPSRVPSRHLRWQTLYDLSSHVLTGFGVDLSAPQHLLAPGYVLHMPKAWEDALVAALRFGLPYARIHEQRGFVLGKRNGRSFETTPDITVEHNHKRFVVDAKYKTRLGHPKKSVIAEDVYEGIAFMRASNCSRLALVYPAPPQAGPAPIGTMTLFETIELDNMAIYAYHVECRGISRRNGLRDMGKRMGATITSKLG